METIRIWLNSARDYDLGVKLYLQYGEDPDLKSLFTLEGRSSFKEKKLQQLLEELYQNSKQPPTEKVKAVISVQQSPFTQHKYWPAQPIADQVINALWLHWRPLYAEMMSLQQRILDVALHGQSDPNKAIEAGQMALRILDLDEEVEWIYVQRNYYVAEGRLPEEKKPQEETIVDPVKWATELKNNERYVREYRLKLKKDPTNKKTAKWAMALQQIGSDRPLSKTAKTRLMPNIEKSSKTDAKTRIILYLTKGEMFLSADEERILARWEHVDFLMRNRIEMTDLIMKHTHKFGVSKFTAENDIYAAQEVFARLHKINKKYVGHLHLQDIEQDLAKVRKALFKVDKDGYQCVPDEKEMMARQSFMIPRPGN